MSADIFVITWSGDRHHLQGIIPAGLLQPAECFLYCRKNLPGKFLVLSDPVMLTKGPHSLTPAVKLAILETKFSILSLPAWKKIKALTGNVMITGNIIHPHNIGSIPQPEGIILKFVHFLDIIFSDLIAGNKIADQIGLKGLDNFLFWQGNGNTPAKIFSKNRWSD